MSKLLGARSVLFLNQYNLSGYSNEIASSLAMSSIDVTSQGQTGTPSKARLPGAVEWKLSEKGFWDYGTSGLTPDEALQALLGTQGQVIFSPGGGNAGDVAYAGYSSPFTGISIMNPVNGAVGFTLDVSGANKLARVKTLGFATATGAQNGAAQDLGAAGVAGVEAFLAVTAFSGTNATIKIQSSADGLTGWADRATFTLITGVTSERITGGTTTDRYLRYALTGTLSSITFIVVAANVNVTAWS